MKDLSIHSSIEYDRRFNVLLVASGVITTISCGYKGILYEQHELEDDDRLGLSLLCSFPWVDSARTDIQDTLN